jgi:hypothetical protein
MTGSGGWPLSVFLTPEGKPFFGGTYFPPEDRYGRAGFEKILLSISKAWKERGGELKESAEKLGEAISAVAIEGAKSELSAEILEQAYDNFSRNFDATNGGFGGAPKFPQATNLTFLLNYWHRTGEKRALEMVERTLDEMADGGIYDHLGGGFHRYATDNRWLVPHFEKMLYDQALISRAYLQAYQATKNERYAQVAREVFDYVLRDMRDEGGGFYSAEDADSEGREGLFYVWEAGEIEEILGDDAELFKDYYGVTESGNFEEGTSILNLSASIEELAEKYGKSGEEIKESIKKSREKLFESRSKRIRPGRDEKVISGWNGLMIASMAYGGAVLGEEKYIRAAEEAADFVTGKLTSKGRLLRYYKDGQAKGLGYLDDHAFVIAGLLGLYEARFDVKWLKLALELNGQMVELFYDEKDGGFFFTGDDSEKLIARSKPNYDGAVPTGNSVAAWVLLRLGRLTMDEKIADYGRETLEYFSPQLNRGAASLTEMLSAVSFLVGPSQEIVIAGGSEGAGTEEMIKAIRGTFLPNAVILMHSGEEKSIYDIVPFIKVQSVIDGKATAYLCENYVCRRPVNSSEEFSKILSKIHAGGR